MKLSTTLLDEDVDTLDNHARSSGLKSRSAAVQHAIRLLEHLNLEDDYATASRIGCGVITVVREKRGSSATGSRGRRTQQSVI